MKTAAELQALAQQELCKAKTEFANFLEKEMDRIDSMCEANAKLGLSSYRHQMEPSNGMYTKYGPVSDKILSSMIESKLRTLGYRTMLMYSAGFHLIISW